jgi:hypothetical protein
MTAIDHEHALISGIISYHVMQSVLCLNRYSNHREHCRFAAVEHECPSHARVCGNSILSQGFVSPTIGTLFVADDYDTVQLESVREDDMLTTYREQ